jgi:protein-disulfide isomerase
LQLYRALAQRYRLTGTPTFVIGERVLVGALPTATLASAAQAALATADAMQA